jgi:aspartate aminotransferase
LATVKNKKFVRAGWVRMSCQQIQEFHRYRFRGYGYMLKLSERSRVLPASPIRKLAPYAEAARRKGVKVYHLNIGQPDIQTPPQFLQAISAANLGVIEYSHSAGIEELRRQIVNYYQRWGYPLKLAEVLVTCGASEALSFALTAVLDPSDEVIIPEPFYANYLSFALASNGVVVPVQTEIENHFALPDISRFEEAITPRTKAIMICNPGNPTGIIYPREALQRLAELVQRRDLFLIADEVYREFNYGSEPCLSALGLAGIEDRVIVVDSISKRFSACGARVGCVLSRNADLMDAVLRMAQARLSPPTLGQIGAAAVYQLPEEYYQGVIREYAERRDVLKAALDRIPGLFCPQINGAFYAMVKLPVADADHFCQWMLEEFSHNGATVMMAPGSGFYSSPGKGKDQVRLAYVLKGEDLRQAVACLEAGLAAYPGRI